MLARKLERRKTRGGKKNQPTIENKGGDHKEKLSMNCETINADIHGCVFLVSMDNALDYRSRP